jgi:hypothetical protein
MFRTRRVTQSFTPDMKRPPLAAGCHLARFGKGNNETWFSPVRQVHFVVDSGIKPRQTANAVLKQAGLPKHF